jgi:hypothetical protein
MMIHFQAPGIFASQLPHGDSLGLFTQDLARRWLRQSISESNEALRNLQTLTYAAYHENLCRESICVPS